MQPRQSPGLSADALPIWNWHEQLETEGVYMYYWQANASNGGRDVKRQAISFPGAGATTKGAAQYMVNA